MARLAIGSSLMVIVFMGGTFRRHYNPAVTLALTLRGPPGCRSRSLLVAPDVGFLAAAAVVQAGIGYRISSGFFGRPRGLAFGKRGPGLWKFLFTFALALSSLTLPARWNQG